jgi:polyisoprenoid-binding protein YceI
MTHFSKFFGVLLSGLFFSFMLVAQNGERYEIAKTSEVQWEAEKVTGQHNGLISVKRGYITLNADSSLEHATVFINMQSIRCLDLEDDALNSKLVNHLKSDDFFSSKRFPEAVFKVYKVTPMDHETYTHTIEGSLTIKGYTNKLAFPVTIEQKNGKVLVNGKTDVDRTLYDIKYGSGKFFDNLGDNMIYDLFTVTFKIVAELPKK